MQLQENFWAQMPFDEIAVSCLQLLHCIGFHEKKMVSQLVWTKKQSVLTLTKSNPFGLPGE